MMTLLQTLSQVSEQSAVIAEKDPHGIIVSTVSIVAVFLSLLTLFLVYLLIGKLVRMAKERYRNLSEKDIAEDRKEETCSNSTAAENIITIRRKPKITISAKEDISRIGHAAETDEGTVETRSSCNESGIVRSPLPGVMTGIKVNAGDKVRTGSELAVLEAMKMENAIESEYDGTVVEIYVSKGDSVLEGTPLMKIQ